MRTCEVAILKRMAQVQKFLLSQIPFVNSVNVVRLSTLTEIKKIAVKKGQKRCR
jgi:hypothetical protein